MRIKLFDKKRTIILLFLLLIMINAVSCKNKPVDENGYKLKHNLQDLEYYFSWDTLISLNPEIEDNTKYDRFEVFVGRGNAGGFISLDSNSPASWLSARLVESRPETGEYRSFRVWLWFFDTKKELDEHMKSEQMKIIPVQKEGDYQFAVYEGIANTLQLVVAGNRLCLLINDYARPETSFFLGKEKLTEMLPMIKDKITSTVITPLPWPKIPRK